MAGVGPGICARVPHAATGQLIEAPPAHNALARRAWLAALRGWRAECAAWLRLNETLFESAALAWTASAYVTVQMHPFDLAFYSQAEGRYTVRKWLDGLSERYGGIDSALLWPTYPHLGVDDRNQYDMVRLMPGGVAGLRQVVAELKAANVSALWPYNPWDDLGTRDEGLAAPEALARLIVQTGAYGFNADTMGFVPEAFYAASVAAGRPAAIQAEDGGAWESLPYTTLGWGESGWGGSSLRPAAPRVATFKWLQRRRMTTVCRRWDTNRTDALQTAWFNGIGYTAWENVWGC